MSSYKQPLRVDQAVASVGVIGASGFSGALAADILWRHPAFSLDLITAQSRVGGRLSSLYPRYRVPLELKEFDAKQAAKLDAAIVGYPHHSAAVVVEELVANGVKVVDLSADFRIKDAEIYQQLYGQHSAPALLNQAQYGLTELNREKIRNSDLIANPGCYATAVILALAPLARDDLIEQCFIDAKSGVSGAGRATTEVTHFVAVNEDVKPYAVTGHRHQPEIVQELKSLGNTAPISFVPHLLPIDQGLLASCYLIPKREIDQQQLDRIYADIYGQESFIELADRPPGVREVAATNYCRIFPVVNGDLIYIFSAIDNLWKGAAGQAVQNLNLRFGLSEREGLCGY